MLAAVFRKKNFNRKLSPVVLTERTGRSVFKRPVALPPFCSTTSVSIEATCPSSCMFKRTPEGWGGCFAEAGLMRIVGLKLDEAARGRPQIEAILDEIQVLDGAFPRGVPQDGARGGRDLRIHVAGDTPSAGAASLLGESAERWCERGGGTVWTYTHVWKTIPRKAWGKSITVLASIEEASQVRDARRQGYAPALVVEHFPFGKRPFTVAGTKFIPCPAETLQKTCVQCRLCLDVDLFKKKMGIAFEKHGRDAKKIQLTPLRVRRPKIAALAG